MGKYLRPRRGYENDAKRENIKLFEGEMFMEFPEGSGIGKSPGRIVIGNGNDYYQSKVNNSTAPADFKPFITDPSLYQPIYKDSSTTAFPEDDQDRGVTILEKMQNAIRTLPEMIGYFKEILCEHTVNLRYDDKRINNLATTVSHTTNVFSGEISTLFDKTANNASSITNLNNTLNATSTSLIDKINGATSTLNSYINTATSTLNTRINGKADVNHTHSQYATVGQLNSMSSTLNTSINTKANSSTLVNYVKKNQTTSDEIKIDNIITGFLPITQKKNTRIVFTQTGSFDTTVKAGEIGYFIFNNGSAIPAGVPAIAVYSLNSNNQGATARGFWNVYNCGDTGWVLTSNDVGTVKATYTNSAGTPLTVYGIGIIFKTG